MTGRSKKEIADEYNRYVDSTEPIGMTDAVAAARPMSAALRLILEVLLDIREEVYLIRTGKITCSKIIPKQ